MGCLQTLKGIASDCANTIGGLKKVWFVNSSDIAAPTPATGGGNQYSIASADMAKFKQYDVDRYSSSLTSTFTAGENGNKYWTHDIALQFRNMTADKHEEMQSLSQASLTMVAQDNNGNYWCVPDVEMNGGTAQTGTGIDDLNGYNPTFSTKSVELPMSLVSFTPAEPTTGK